MQSPALPVEIFHVLAKCLSKALVSSELPSLMASQYPSITPRNTKRVRDGLLTEKKKILLFAYRVEDRNMGRHDARQDFSRQAEGYGNERTETGS